METHDHVEVILVEDRPEDAELTLDSLLFNKLANHIKVLEDGQEALDYLFDDAGNLMPGSAKLILLDLKLPKVSGLEVLTKLKENEHSKHIPVVVLTSSAEDMDVQRAYELGANSYIVKPVDFDKFSKAIAQVGMYWLLLNKGRK